MTPKPPALDTAAARGPPEVRAMPARIMGYLIPRSLHNGVRRVGVRRVCVRKVGAGIVTCSKQTSRSWNFEGDVRLRNQSYQCQSGQHLTLWSFGGLFIMVNISIGAWLARILWGRTE